MALMVHDSDPNAAKTCFVHVKSGCETLFFDPRLKKWGELTPSDPWFRGRMRTGKLRVRVYPRVGSGRIFWRGSDTGTGKQIGYGYGLGRPS